MKKLNIVFKASTLLIALLLSIRSSAQDLLGCEIVYSNFSRTFEYLTDGTRVNDIESTCGAKSGIPLGFTFKFGPTVSKAGYTTVQVSSAGWIKFGAALSGCSEDVSTKNVYPGLWLFYGKKMNGSAGQATYYTELLPSGLKVFTMEWKDWTWDSVAVSPATSFRFSAQIKLYEGSDVIEYCFKRETGSTAVSGSNPYMMGMGVIHPSAAATAPCPGYNMFTIAGGSIPVTPTVNRTGSYGASQMDFPNTNDVYQFYQKCSGKPSAGLISQPDSVCVGSPFVLRTSGSTPNPFPSYGVSYQWQASPSSTGPWSDIVGATAVSHSFPGVYNDTFFRLIVYCANSNRYDTSAPHHITLITKSYNCYCYGASTNDILNVNINKFNLITKGNDTLFNVGDNSPSFINKGIYYPYTLNTGLAPIRQINRDTTYTFSVVGKTRDSFSFASSGVALYIDYNGDGIYNASSELASFQVISGTKADFVTTFTVPPTAKLDTVGMRIVMTKGVTTASAMSPCGAFADGEVEDYIIEIANPKCPGPISAGTSYISDTSICINYPATVWNIGHGLNMSKMYWAWESSLDNILWTEMASSRFMDTIQPIIRQTTYFRMKTVCEFTQDTIFSNTVNVKAKKPFKCYCYSLANGGQNADSSDISTFNIGKFTSSVGGPHLKNPKSIRQRTDFTDLPAIELYSQDKYNISVYHTLKSYNHSDAKVSVFMDFNHDMQYSASELIWSTTTTSTNYYPHDSITIPVRVIPDVETGMRVVLNNDLGTNNPNDIGCDEFVSGEIEDYLVIFRRRGTNITELANVDNLQIYPNPSNGNFMVTFNTKSNLQTAQIVINTISGQQVFSETYNNINNSFVKEINLKNQATGMYFITIVADGQKQVHKLMIK